MQRTVPLWWLGVAVAVAVDLVPIHEPKAQTPGGEDATVLAADQMLAEALRNGDKWAARKLLALQFTFVDENGKIEERRNFLANLKDMAAATASDVKVRTYGRVAMVTGHRMSAHGSDAFFLDIWEKQKGAWRVQVMQDVVLLADEAPPAVAAAPVADAKPYECKNPCQAIPYRVRSPAEQDIITSFQAIERAVIAHDADAWGRLIADEFVLYGTGRAPAAKSDRMAAIKRQKEDSAPVTVGEVQTMRLSVYDDGAAMIATHAVPDNSRPAYRAARVWVRRNGQWQLAISVQTAIKSPPP